MNHRTLSYIFLFLLLPLHLSAELKYVFYFIGDGMGINHILLTEKYLSRLKGKDGRIPLNMTLFPYCGMVATHSKLNDITDSAAAGTCLATGKKTVNGKIGMDDKDQAIQSITDILHNNGWNIGIGTSVSIDHATPASFYAHTKSRKDYYEIGQQLIASNYEFFGGTPFLQPTPKENDPLDNLYDKATAKGYTFAYGYKDALTKLTKKKMILFPPSIDPKNKTAHDIYKLPFAIDKSRSDLTLQQITDIAVKKLGDKKFFIVIEGGAIDFASHDNDAKSVIGEMLEFDAAISTAYNFYSKHPDETLIVVTADHETGGLSLGIENEYYLHLTNLRHQRSSTEALKKQIQFVLEENGKKCTWEQIKSPMTMMFGLFNEVEVTKEEETTLLNIFEEFKKSRSQTPDVISKYAESLSHNATILLNRKALLGWSTIGHTGAFVPVFSIGVGAEQFTGVLDNTEIIPLIQKIIKSN